MPLPRGPGGQEGIHHRGHPGMLPGKWQLAGHRIADHPAAQRDPQPERLPLRHCGEDSGRADHPTPYLPTPVDQRPCAQDYHPAGHISFGTSHGMAPDRRVSKLSDLCSQTESVEMAPLRPFRFQSVSRNISVP